MAERGLALAVLRRGPGTLPEIAAEQGLDRLGVARHAEIRVDQLLGYEAMIESNHHASDAFVVQGRVELARGLGLANEFLESAADLAAASLQNGPNAFVAGCLRNDLQKESAGGW